MTRILKLTVLILFASLLLSSCGVDDLFNLPESSDVSDVSDISDISDVSDVSSRDPLPRPDYSNLAVAHKYAISKGNRYLSITLFSNGTGVFTTPPDSLDDGACTWFGDGNVLRLKANIGKREYRFDIKDNSIAYIAEGSDQFDVLTLNDGDDLPSLITTPDTEATEPYYPKSVTFSRKNDNGFDSFTITLSEGGTFSYYESFISSHIGFGVWTFDGDIVCMREKYSSVVRKYNFKYESGKLIYIADGSDNFSYSKLDDGAEFTTGGKLSELPDGTTYCRQGESMADNPTFFLTIFDNGNYVYLNGYSVSTGKWTLDGDTYRLAETQWFGRVYEFYFKKDGENLVYISEKSDQFPYEKLKYSEVLYPEEKQTKVS